ncbi:hypothetical protein M9Y10_005587 [Tritrichomonas musculus]|uniref:Uncharacterized protein n=1 Tax=Tritrichomonas musculus TaxID=1915356 RepID=A0ABR2JE70_9EUKA
MRTYDILILGIETKIGQKIYSLLEQDYSFLSIAVPLSKYSQSIRFPQNQVKINLSSKSSIESIVSSFNLIVAFDKRKQYNELKKEAKESFLDVSTFSLQMIIEIFKQKIPINSIDSKYELNVQASRSNIFKFIFYPKSDFLPVFSDKSYKVKIKEIDPFSNFNLVFSTHILALLFVLFGALFKPFIFLLQLLGLAPNIPFNEKSTLKHSITIQWKAKKNPNSKQIELIKYFIDPNQDENEVMSDYFRLKLINKLCLNSLSNSYESKSIIWKQYTNTIHRKRQK